MTEDDKYYLCYDRLMRTAPERPLEEVSQYKDLAVRYPHIAKSIRLRMEMKRLEEESRSAREKSTRLQIRRQIKRHSAELKRQGILKRIHGESKQETSFQIRFTVENLKRRLSSLALRARNVYLHLQEKLREQSRRSRRTRAERLPPSLFDLRSLDSADRGLALREWVKKSRVRIRPQ